MVENFMEELLKGLQMSSANEVYDFKIMDVVRRNDEHKKSLFVKKKGSVIGANLYMGDLVRRYTYNECNMNAFIGDVIELIREKVLEDEFEEELVNKAMELQDYEKVKDRILFRLVNLNANEEYLKNLIHVPFLDLAVCFYIAIGDDNEIGAIQLSKDIFSFWNVSIEEVYQQAMKNAPLLMPYKLRSMTEVYEILMDKEEFDQYMNPPEYEDNGFWVLGNEKHIFGASVVLYDGIMKEIAERMNVKDIVILMSSVHECMLLALPKDYDVNCLRDLVSDVNDKQIDPEDRLSYSIYRYSLESDEISILTE